MDEFFKGKRVVVTGGAQGIGRGIVLELLKLGGTVLVIDNNKQALDSIKKEIAPVQTLQVDLSNWSSTSDSIKTLYPIDLLVNNAGICYLDPITAISEEHFDKTFNVNVKALVNVTKTVVENLLDRKVGGSIVNISSQASKAGLLHHGLYCATKGAVDAFTRAAALELGPNKIRVNCVNPTVVLTDLGRKVWGDPAMGGPMLEKIPLNRFAEIADVVNSVIFLLSDKSDMITGTCLPVDGGFLAC